MKEEINVKGHFPVCLQYYFIRIFYKQCIPTKSSLFFKLYIQRLYPIWTWTATNKPIYTWHYNIWFEFQGIRTYVTDFITESTITGWDSAPGEVDPASGTVTVGVIVDDVISTTSLPSAKSYVHRSILLSLSNIFTTTLGRQQSPLKWTKKKQLFVKNTYFYFILWFFTVWKHVTVTRGNWTWINQSGAMTIIFVDFSSNNTFEKFDNQINCFREEIGNLKRLQRQR